MTARDVANRLVQSREESTEVRSLLEAGITDDVADYDFARGLETHLAAVGAAPGGGGPGAPAGAGPGASSAAKALALAIGVPVVSLSVAAAVMFLRTQTPAPSDSAHSTGRTPSAVVQASSPTERVAGTEVGELPEQARSGVTPSENAAPRGVPIAPEAHRRPGAGAGKLTLAEDVATPPPEIAGKEASERTSGIVRSFPEGPVESGRANAVQTAGTEALSPPAAAPAATREEPRPSEDALARAERAREEARHDAEDKLQREMEELMRAKRALSSDPKLALQLAEHGQREFKQSLLSEEREHVLLLALIGVGRVTEAERRAAPYLAKHPDSPFARRVRAALEAHKVR